jgi:hypothetical protein
VTTWLLVSAVTALALALTGWAVTTLVRRHRTRAAESFACKVRRGGRRTWPHRRTHATWVHDVLIVERGVFFHHMSAYPVRLPEDVIHEVSPREVTGLGPRPLAITLRLDDGPLIYLAAGEGDRTALAGPFLAVAVAGAKAGPRENPPTADHPSTRSD